MSNMMSMDCCYKKTDRMPLLGGDQPNFVMKILHKICDVYNKIGEQGTKVNRRLGNFFP